MWVGRYVRVFMYVCRKVSYVRVYVSMNVYTNIYTVGYARTNVIGSRTSFVIASVRSSIH
jgi:hypothetical protein